MTNSPQVAQTSTPIQDRAIRSSQTAQPARTADVAEISTPVGTDEDGQIVFARVGFTAPINRDYISKLKKYLDYLESAI